MNLGEWLWAMAVFFFWFMAIWIFIQDLRRYLPSDEDLSGGAKAGWIFLLFVLPFLGALIYMDRAAEDDRAGPRRHREGAGSAAPPVRLLAGRGAREAREAPRRRRAQAEEYERLKARALVEI